MRIFDQSETKQVWRELATFIYISAISHHVSILYDTGSTEGLLDLEQGL